MTTPDDWTHQPDGNGNMLLIAGDHSASYALSVGGYEGALDDLAAGAMKAAGAHPPQNMGPTQISGFRGYMYDSDMTNAAGLHINVHMVVIKIGEAHMASITMMTIDGVSASDYAAARGVLGNAAIIGPN
jgi:hypothetical protein